jgi:hypothetical protein
MDEKFKDVFPSFSQQLATDVSESWDNPNLEPLAGIPNTGLLGTAIVEARGERIMDVQVGVGPENDLIIHVKTGASVNEDNIVQLIQELDSFVTELRDLGINPECVRCISDSTSKALNPQDIVAGGGLDLLGNIIGEKGSFFVIQPLLMNEGSDISSLTFEQGMQAWLISRAAGEVMPPGLTHAQKEAFVRRGAAVYSSEKDVFITEGDFLSSQSFGIAPQGVDADKLLAATYELLTRPQQADGGEG